MSDIPRPAPRDPRPRDAATIRQATEGILLVVGLAALAAAVGAVLSLVIAWVY